MADISSKIEAAKAQVDSLQKQIEKIQKSKRDKTLGQVVKSKGTPLTAIRVPPATRARRTLKGHFGKVTALHWAGDSRTLVSASQDGNLLVWNAVTAHKVQAITLKSSYVMAVGIETKGNMVACGGLDNLCTVYNRGNPANATEMAGHEGFLSCCRFVDEQNIVTTSGDGTAIHWDITKGRPVSTFQGHTSDVMFMALKDKNIFATCSVDKTAKIWDVRAPTKSVQTFGGHLGDVNGIDFMPSDENCFATCCQDGGVRVFDLRVYNELQRFGTPVAPTPATVENDGFTCLTFSASGRLIFCGHGDGSIHAYDTLSEKKGPVFTMAGSHERHVSCIGVSSQGNALCSGSWDSVLKVWA